MTLEHTHVHMYRHVPSPPTLKLHTNCLDYQVSKVPSFKKSSLVEDFFEAAQHLRHVQLPCACSAGCDRGVERERMRRFVIGFHYIRSAFFK